MNVPRNFVLVMALATAAIVPAWSQTVDPETAAPDFSGVWTHPAFPWFEPPASGPGPVTNLSRWAEQRPSGAAGSAPAPPTHHGNSDHYQLLRDYKKPNLHPPAAPVSPEI